MTPPTVTHLGLRQLSRAEGVDRLARRFGVTRAEIRDAPSPELLAEAAREVVFRYSLRGGASAPVHVQSITNQLRRELSPVWPTLAGREAPDWRELGNVRHEEEGEESRPEISPIRRCLEILEKVGDVQHVGSGYWLPTPTRLVQLANDPESKVLLIGGAPLQQLRLDGYRFIDSCGNVRGLPLKVLPASVRQDDTAWQSLDGWLGRPSAPLAEWAAQLLDRASVERSTSHGEVGPFEVYDPAGHRWEPQFFRWTADRAFQPSAESLYLCRTIPERGVGARRFWVGRLAHREGAVRPQSEYPLSGTDIRRLQYALDTVAGAPTRASVSYGQTSVKVTLSSLLPDPEYRLLLAVGEECSARLGRLPMAYELRRDVAEPVLDRITELGIEWR